MKQHRRVRIKMLWMFWKVLRHVFPVKARKRFVLLIYEEFERLVIPFLKYAQKDYQRDPFLNCGYIPLSVSEPRLELLEEHEKGRRAAQLYFHVAGQVDLTEHEVLEVGSGRGEGCQFIRKYLKARRVVGLDLSKIHVAMSCRTNE
ncbi:hypothetical protein IIB34_05805, partial [PVC group bacterium]|nr:hypothetical protein [PVC group bacterium]